MLLLNSIWLKKMSELYICLSLYLVDNLNNILETSLERPSVVK